MSESHGNPRIYSPGHLPISQEVAAFLVDRQARGLSPGSVHYYREKLAIFTKYLACQDVDDVHCITPQILRAFLLAYGQEHKPGGVMAVYRAVKAFLRWWEEETEPEGWTNPLRKVRAPRVNQPPLPPADLEDVRAMLKACEAKTFTGDRDKAILLFLLDTGVRRAELCAMDLADVNLQDGTVVVRRGKGGKRRVTFVGAKTRRALVAYLRHRHGTTGEDPLWVTETDTRLSHAGLREIVRRRARQAGVPAPSLHAFRRAFALLSLRAGANVYALQRLMGHSNVTVLARYLALQDDDLRREHQATGPVDSTL